MTSDRPKLYLNLYWHMHQPDYRDTLTGEYMLPWTYLHAIKDYTDMAYHMEANPQARATFNFVPVLLDQLEDYCQQFADKQIRDPLLRLLAEPDLVNITIAQRQLVFESCFKNHHEKMLEPFPHYQCLFNLYKTLEAKDPALFNYLSRQYMADLLVWYHLAWTGESIRRENTLVQALMHKGYQFTLEDRLALFDLIGELIAGLIPRYKKLQERKQIEVTTTPHYHPILPLLLDFRSTRDALPFAPLPHFSQYPGGKVRARAHIAEAMASHQKRFGQAPVGMWPAEGGVSQPALLLMAEQGVRWAATGEGVLANSLYKSHDLSELPPRNAYLYQPYKLKNGSHEILCFFRDDGLSDKVGFEYAKFHASDAVTDFISALEGVIHAASGDNVPVVSVILDGENAWEYYPYNGYYFLHELYEALAKHPDIQMTTFSDIVRMVDSGKVAATPLTAIAAGSWVYGSFSTWIGSTEKNLAWDMLCAAKTTYDEVMLSGMLTDDEVTACEHQLAICEGSDWFWWFGDYNSALSVESFDRLYRLNLANLYALLKKPKPEVLDYPISKGGGDPAVGGTMRRGSEN